MRHILYFFIFFLLSADIKAEERFQMEEFVIMETKELPQIRDQLELDPMSKSLTRQLAMLELGWNVMIIRVK